MLTLTARLRDNRTPQAVGGTILMLVDMSAAFAKASFTE
jgi:hypothetical protein